MKDACTHCPKLKGTVASEIRRIRSNKDPELLHSWRIKTYIDSVLTIYGTLVNNVVANLINKRSTAEETQCYANNNDPYTYFGTKTSYFVVDNEDVTPIQVEGKKSIFSISVLYNVRNHLLQRNFVGAGNSDIHNYLGSGWGCLIEWWQSWYFLLLINHLKFNK